MYCNQIFSLISTVGDKNIVQNIIICDSYEKACQIARVTYDVTAYAVDTTQYPVTIGDSHKDGIFYRGGGASGGESGMIQPNPTEKEMIEQLKQTNAGLSGTIDSLTIALAEVLGG